MILMSSDTDSDSIFDYVLRLSLMSGTAFSYLTETNQSIIEGFLQFFTHRSKVNSYAVRSVTG